MLYIVTKSGYGWLALMGVYSSVDAILQAFDVKEYSTDAYGEMLLWLRDSSILNAYPATLDQEMGSYGKPADGYGVTISEWDMED